MRLTLSTIVLGAALATSAFGQVRQTSIYVDNNSGIFGSIVATGLTAPHTYTLPNVDGTLAVDIAGGYLPLSGGNMTGAINMGAFNISNGGTFTATSFVGALSGNASTATALATPRAINGVNFDGTGPITVTAAAGTLSGTALAAGVTGSSLTSVGTLTGLTMGGTLNLNTNNITGGGTITATTFSGALSGNATTATTATNFSGSLAGDVTGTQGATVVGKLLGNTIPVNAAGVLTNNGSGTLTWSASSSTLAGDVSGTTGANTVDKIKGNTVPANATGYLRNNGSGTLTWSSTSGSCIFVGQTTNNQDASTDYYAPMGGTVGNNHTASFVASDIRMPRAGTVQNFYVDLSVAPGGTNSRTFSITNVTTSATLAVTISTSSTAGSNTASTLAVSAGDVLRIAATAVNNGGMGNGQAAWSFEFQ